MGFQCLRSFFPRFRFAEPGLFSFWLIQGAVLAWQGRGIWHFATQVFGQRLISFEARIWDLWWFLRGSIGTRWADWGAPRPRLGQRLSGYSVFVLSFPPFCFREPGLLSFWLIQGAVLRGRGEGLSTSLLRFLATVYSVFWPGFGSFCGCSGAPSGTRWADWGAPRPRLRHRIWGFNVFVIFFSLSLCGTGFIQF